MLIWTTIDLNIFLKTYTYPTPTAYQSKTHCNYFMGGSTGLANDAHTNDSNRRFSTYPEDNRLHLLCTLRLTIDVVTDHLL